MKLISKIAVKFVIVFFAMIIVSSVVWQAAVAGTLYNCTDDNLFGFWTPGGWVHFDHGVVYVPHVNPHDSMSEPDSIKQGWSIGRLWLLWISFFVVSIFVAALLALKRWIPVYREGSQPYKATALPRTPGAARRQLNS